MPHMLRGLLLALLLVSLPPRLQEAAPSTLTLELRIFDGSDEVTAETRLTLHRAGDRGQPFAQSSASKPRLALSVPPGIYDVQAIHERDGRVLNIRWANRLVVMPYPDEGGHHLEIVNFKTGFGALQVRGPDATGPDVALFPAGNRNREAAAARRGEGYAVFVVPAGRYDLQVRKGGQATWHADIEVPLDRTRLWVIP